jgi:DNA (cytosine-5)-methyltransferase 1
MFTGIGGFELGIEKAYSKIEPKDSTDSKSRTPQYFGCPLCVGYSEIDKHAILTYEHHYPNHKNYGDATKINPEELPDFDVLCGGFPCQSFSIAGKRMGFEDTRGTLFFDIARIIKIKRPCFLFLENVKGLLSHDNGRTFATILATLNELGYDAEWEVLNSKHFGVPQNRERVFIIGHLRGTPSKQIFPIGKGNGTSNKKVGERMECVNTLTKGYHKGRQASAPHIKTMNTPKHSNDRVYSDEGLSPSLNTAQGGNRQPFIPVLTPDRPEKRQNGRRMKEDGEEMFTLTGQDTHGIAIMDLYNHKEHTDRCPTLTEPHHNTIRVREGMKIRRLTPIEYERLQGFPDNWTIGSDTQRYKQCGNAVTVNVIQAIAEKILAT